MGWILTDKDYNRVLGLGDLEVTGSIVIDQGSADGEILSLKSSDVSHGLIGVIETDIYGSFSKTSGNSGGLKIWSFGEDNAALSNNLVFYVAGGQAPTVKTPSGASALVQLYITEHDGADSLANITANGNIFALTPFVDSAWKTVFLVDEDGDLHLNGNIYSMGSSMYFYNSSGNTLGVIGLSGYAAALYENTADVGCYLTTTSTQNNDQQSGLLLMDSSGNVVQFGCYHSSHGTYPGWGYVFNHVGSAFNQFLLPDGSVQQPNQPCFQVRMLTAQANIATGSEVTIQYNLERFDVNSDFNTTTYTFTAPVTGKYLLVATAWLQNWDTAATWYYLAIKTSNHAYRQIKGGPDFTADNDYVSMQVTAIAEMEANDTAYVVIYQNGGSQQTDIQTGGGVYSLFSGYFLG